MSELDYNNKIMLCEKLGAKKFQKFVFKVENIKWKIVKKIIPNYIKYGDRIIEHQLNKKIKKAKNQIEIDNIKRNATMSKMQLRKEYNKSKNINYHINKSKPSEFIQELNWNKDIHKRGLIANALFLPASIIASSIGFIPAIPLAIYELFSTFINFQCVNVQNYNIYRLKKVENRLKEREIKEEDKQIEKYRDAYELIGKELEEKKDIINLEELVSSIKTKEQLIQLKELIKEEKLQRNKNRGGKNNGHSNRIR